MRKVLVEREKVERWTGRQTGERKRKKDRNGGERARERKREIPADYERF